MKVELQADGTVLNTYLDDEEAGEWYPDDTVIRQETEAGYPTSTSPMRISRHQPDGWARRAARRWNEKTGRWESTGGPTEKSELEKARAELELPPLPDDASLDDVIKRLNASAVVTADQEKQRIKVTARGESANPRKIVGR